MTKNGIILSKRIAQRAPTSPTALPLLHYFKIREPMTRKLPYILFIALLFQFAFADTKGLNQVVTPSITPLGILTTSFQLQHQYIGDVSTLQFEFGVFKGTEMTVWQSQQKDTFTLAEETQIYAKKGFQLSGGTFYFDNQFLPFIVGGYRKGPYFAEIGAQDVQNIKELILGTSYDFNSTTSFLGDFISGPGNSLTFGLNININKRLSCNPALYYGNDNHKLFPYFVVTYTWGG